MNPLRLFCCLLAAARLCAAPALAQSGLTKLGEFKVNTTVAGDQRDPSIARDKDGNFVVVWESVGPDNVHWVFGQLYDVAASPVGPEFRVDTTLPMAGTRRRPQVAMDRDGRFVVVWQTDAGDAVNLTDVYFRRYSADGKAVGSGDLRVNTSRADRQFHPSVAINAAGNFLVVWFNDAVTGGRLQGLRFKPDSTPDSTLTNPIRGIFAIDANAGAGVADVADVAATPSNHFVVVWPRGVATSSDVFGRVIDGTDGGSPPTEFPEFPLNATTTGVQSVPRVACFSDERFVAVWQSEGQAGEDFEVKAQIFPSTLAPPPVSPPPPEFAVNDTTPGRQVWANVAVTPEGGFAVAWTSRRADGSDAEMAFRRFDAQGAAREADDSSANTFPTGLQENEGGRSLATDADGNLVVVWQSQDQDGSGLGIYAEKFYLPGKGPALAEFRVNTTTAGDQREPSVASAPDGKFAVVWVEAGPAGRRICRQDYAADGLRHEMEKEVSAADVEGGAVIAMNAAGKSVVAWVRRANSPGPENLDIYAQRFDEVGQPDGDVIAVSVDDDRATSPSVALLTDNRLVIAWVSAGQGDHIFSKVFDGGTAVGQVQVDAAPPGGHQVDPDVAVFPDSKKFVVLWADSPGVAVVPYLRIYDAESGSLVPRTGPLPVLGADFSAPAYPTSLAVDGLGRIVCAWTQQGGNTDVFAQRLSVEVGSTTDTVTRGPAFRISGGALGGTEGAETGAQQYPSVAALANGNFFATWCSDEIEDAGFDVYVRRFQGNGALADRPKSSEGKRRVNRYQAGEQGFFPPAASPLPPERRGALLGRRKVAADTRGNYVVVWQSEGQDGSGYGVYAAKIRGVGEDAPKPIDQDRPAFKLTTPTLQWRPQGTLVWLNSGDSARLLPGEYSIEFRDDPANPVRRAPTDPLPRPQFFTVAPGADGAEQSESLRAQAGGRGSLVVSIEDEDGSNRLGTGQWQFAGETEWRDGGLASLALDAGAYRLKFKDVAGRALPPPQTVLIEPGETSAVRARYRRASQATGPPGVKPERLEFKPSTEESPFRFAGQFSSDAGFSSGMVVRERVVLTAGHVAFDDFTLAYVTGLQWRFQRVAGEFEPEPLTPRGSFLFTSYAALRRAALSQPGARPGRSDQASHQRDAAAVYFRDKAGRGGSIDFLPPGTNWLDLGRKKTLVSYPVDPAFLLSSPNRGDADAGRMFRTPPLDATFLKVPTTPGVSEAGLSLTDVNQVSATTEIAGYPGSSGGALCVEYEDSYYPAAVYLGGTDKTVVRAIDGDVAELVKKADTAAQSATDQNNSSGGIVQVLSRLSVLGQTSARLSVDLGPNADLAGRGAWEIIRSDKVGERPASFGRGDTPQTFVLVEAGSYILFFKPVGDFGTPPPYPFTAATTEEIKIAAIYSVPRAPLIKTSKLKPAIQGDPGYKTAVVVQNPADKFVSPKDAARPFGSLEEFGLHFKASNSGMIEIENLALWIAAPSGNHTVKIIASKNGKKSERDVRLTINPEGQLTVTTSGGGTVAGQPAKVAQGETVTLTAKPGGNALFLGWRGSGIPALLPTSERKLTFMMEPVVTLLAEFVENPFPTRAGKYRGLMRGAVASFNERGVAQLTTTRMGGFSGKFFVGGQVFAAKGKFIPDGSYNGAIKFRGESLPLSLRLNTALDPSEITVLVELPATRDAGPRRQFSFTAYPRASPANADPAPDTLAGAFTAAIAADPSRTDAAAYPQGTSVARWIVAPSGDVKGTVWLADGTTTKVGGFFVGTAAGQPPEWTLFGNLYKGNLGAVLGQLTFSAGTPPVTGTLEWYRPADAEAPVAFPHGWPGGTARDGTPTPGVQGALEGYRYEAPHPDLGNEDPKSVLDSIPFGTTTAPEFSRNYRLAVDGEEAVLTLSALGKVTLPDSASLDALKFTLAPATGVFTGSYLAADGKRTFTGVLLQVPLEGRGAGAAFAPNKSLPLTLNLIP